MIKTGNRNFWIAQVLGWGLFAFANFLIQYYSVLNSGTQGAAIQLIINSALAFLGGITVTSAYRYFIKSRKLQLLNFRVVLLYIVLSTIGVTFIFLCLITVVVYFIADGKTLSGMEFFGNFFIFGILMLIWNSLYFLIHYLHSWKNAEAEKWQLQASMKEAQLGSLKAQINPHFMFNTINNIRALILEDPSRSRGMLLHFSDLFRYSLVHSDMDMVTLAEEVEIVEKYFSLLEIQFEERLKHEITVQEGLEEKRIPPMMLQLLAENAVKHGVSELAEGGFIKVNVASAQDHIIMEVSNSGRITDQKNLQGRLGVGLNNIRERLRLIYGGEASFHLTEAGSIVTARIMIPKESSR